MAQPGVALHDAFPLVPPLSPVELAMAGAGAGAETGAEAEAGAGVAGR
jgi:hypothetical protein